jgi:hypothetical protein
MLVPGGCALLRQPVLLLLLFAAVAAAVTAPHALGCAKRCWPLLPSKAAAGV